MGNWGPKLYECDEALQIRDCVSQAMRIAEKADEILTLLQGVSEHNHPDSDVVSIHTLVIVDKFHQYGIVSPGLFAKAELMITQNIDDQKMADMGMNEDDRALRRQHLTSLSEDWRVPRSKPRTRRIKSVPEKHVISNGDIWIYPTADGNSVNTNNRLKDIAVSFQPDGWAAFLVGRTGHRLGIFSTAFIMRLHVDGKDRPDIEQCESAALSGMLLRSWGRDTPVPCAQWCPMSSTVLKKLRAEKIGNIVLQPDKLEEHFPIEMPAEFTEPPAIHNILHVNNKTLTGNQDEWDIAVSLDIDVTTLI